MMKKLIFIFLLFPLLLQAQTNYYVKNGGNDEAAGTSDGAAWATLARVVTEDLGSDDTVFFNRGDTWRESMIEGTDESGTSGHPIVYTAYGTGEQPIFLNSKNESSTGDWIDQGSNIWRNSDATFTVDVGNVVFNGDSCGNKKQALNQVTSQGDFWYDFANDRISIYSVGNPATVYGDIECCLKGNIMEAHSNSYVTYDSLTFKYTGSHAIGGYQCSYITVSHCNFEWIGGSDLWNDYEIRYGNGVEFYNEGSGTVQYCTVEYCRFTEIYDACVTFQGGSGSDAPIYSNITFRYNIFDRAEWLVETSFYGSGTNVSNIYIQNNTFLDPAGQGTHEDRWAAGEYGTFIYFAPFYGTVNGIYVRNNIFTKKAGVNNLPGSGWYGIEVEQAGDEDDITFDYNIYEILGNPGDNANVGILHWDGYETLANWQSATGQEANSQEDDPLFTDRDNFDYTIAEGSPAIDEALGVGYNLDFAGNAVGASPDIGAYEYDSAPVEPPPVPIVTTEILNYNAVYAIVQGVVTDYEGTVSSRGVCYSLSANPTVSDRVMKVGSGTGTFRVHIPIVAGVTFHVRTYAINESGTSYGADQTVTGLTGVVGTSGGKAGTINGKPVEF